MAGLHRFYCNIKQQKVIAGKFDLYISLSGLKVGGLLVIKGPYTLIKQDSDCKLTYLLGENILIKCIFMQRKIIVTIMQSLKI